MPKRGGGQCPQPAFYCGTAAGDGPLVSPKSHARGTGKPGPGRRTPPVKPRQNTRTARPTGVWDATTFLKSAGRNPPGGFRITCSQAR